MWPLGGSTVQISTTYNKRQHYHMLENESRSTWFCFSREEWRFWKRFATTVLMESHSEFQIITIISTTLLVAQMFIHSLKIYHENIF